MRRRKTAKVFTEWDYKWYLKNKPGNFIAISEELVGKPKICEICGLKNKIVVDHNHKTGKFRGFLCGNCNTMVGMSLENEETLKSAAKYLGRNNAT